MSLLRTNSLIFTAGPDTSSSIEAAFGPFRPWNTVTDNSRSRPNSARADLATLPSQKCIRTRIVSR